MVLKLIFCTYSCHNFPDLGWFIKSWVHLSVFKLPWHEPPSPQELPYLLNNLGSILYGSFMCMIVCTQQVKVTTSQDHCWPGTINIRLNLNGSEFILVLWLSVWQNQLVSHLVEEERVSVNKPLMKNIYLNLLLSHDKSVYHANGRYIYALFCWSTERSRFQEV